MSARPNEPSRRFIDFQLTLPALVSGAVVTCSFMLWMGWQASQQTTNTEQLKVSVAKLEKRFDDKDQRIEDMRDKLSDLIHRMDIFERTHK